MADNFYAFTDYKGNPVAGIYDFQDTTGGVNDQGQAKNINYQEIVASAFGGINPQGQLYVPKGVPYYNLATKQDMVSSGGYVNAKEIGRINVPTSGELASGLVSGAMPAQYGGIGSGAVAPTAEQNAQALAGRQAEAAAFEAKRSANLANTNDPSKPSVYTTYNLDGSIRYQGAGDFNSMAALDQKNTQELVKFRAPSGYTTNVPSSIANQLNQQMPGSQIIPAKQYTVVKGDTLSAIAKRNSMSLQQLLALNPQFSTGGRNPDLIYPGDSVKLSSPTTAPAGGTGGTGTGGATGGTGGTGSTSYGTFNLKDLNSSGTTNSGALGGSSSYSSVLNSVGAANNDRKAIQDAMLALLKPSDRESQLQKQLADLQNRYLQGQVGTEGQAIPLGLIGGQLDALKQDVAYRQMPLTSELERLQQSRESGLKSAQALYGFANDDAQQQMAMQKLQYEMSQPDTQVLTETDKNGNVTAVVIDKKTGKVISQSSLGGIGKGFAPTTSSGTGITGDPRFLAMSSAQRDAAFKLADDYEGASKVYYTVLDAYNRIQSSASDPSPAGDLALIFNYMKMLDPGSVVREGEFANAQNAASVPERIRAQYNKVISGERLTPNTRTDFMSTSNRLFTDAQKQQASIVQTFTDRAGRFGIPADLVVRNTNSEIPQTSGGADAAYLQYTGQTSTQTQSGGGLWSAFTNWLSGK